MVLVFENVGEMSVTKNYLIADHLEKCGLSSNFQHGVRSSRSTADLLTVESDRTSRAFIWSGPTQAVALDISKAFDRAGYTDLLHKVKSYGISGEIFGLISSFLRNSFEGFRMGSLHKNI